MASNGCVLSAGAGRFFQQSPSPVKGAVSTSGVFHVSDATEKDSREERACNGYSPDQFGPVRIAGGFSSKISGLGNAWSMASTLQSGFVETCGELLYQIMG